MPPIARYLSQISHEMQTSAYLAHIRWCTGCVDARSVADRSARPIAPSPDPFLCTSSVPGVASTLSP